MRSCAEIHSGISKLTKLKGVTSEQHKEIQQTKVVTDSSDLMKTNDCFSANLLTSTTQNKTL